MTSRSKKAILTEACTTQEIEHSLDLIKLEVLIDLRDVLNDITNTLYSIMHATWHVEAKP